MDTVHCMRSPNARKSNFRAFAALPHDLIEDTRLTCTDRSVLLALTFWARGKDYCWPSDRSIGQRVGRSPATVQRRLKALEAIGLVERIKTDANRTGRVIRLAWRSLTSDRPTHAPVTDPPRSSMRDEEERSVQPEALKKKVEVKSGSTVRSKPEPLNIATAPTSNPRLGSAPASMAPNPNANGSSALVCTGVRNMPTSVPLASPIEGGILPAWLPARRANEQGESVPTGSQLKWQRTGKIQAREWLTSDDPILRAEAERRLRPKPAPKPEPETAAELLERIRENPARVPMAAEILAQTFNDRRSWQGFHSVCRRAFEGSLDPAALVDALHRATAPNVRNGGAVFMTVVNRWPG